MSMIRARCHPDREERARELCPSCYDRAWKRGELDDHPRRTRTIAEFAAEYALLRSAGSTRRQIGERLGYTRMSGVDRAYRKAVDAGLLKPDAGDA